MDFTYLYETELRNPLALSGMRRRLKREKMGTM
jgi:hypothetical protein